MKTMRRRLILLFLALEVIDMTAGAEDLPNLKPKKYAIGIAPSHVTVSPNQMFEDSSQWPKVAEAIDLYKYYDVQLRDLKWATYLDAAQFVGFMKKRGIKIGCEFGEFHLGKGPTVPDAGAVALSNLEPIFAAGGTVDSLHLDGPVRRMIKGCEKNPKAMTLDEITASLVKFWRTVHAKHPKMKIGLISNFPNWDYTRELAGFNGDYTDQCGVTYAEVLDKLHGGLTKAGEKMDFLEIDCPYNYYREKRTRKGDAKVDNPRMFREMQEWCGERDIAFHLIINAEPRDAGAKGFHDLTLEYVRALRRDGIFPDAFLIQSWYEQPEAQIPEDQQYTFMNTAREAIALIRKLYPQEESAKKARHDSRLGSSN